MPNYQILPPLEYNKEKIYNVFGDDQTATYRGCSASEIKEIANILSITHPIKSILYFQLPPNLVGSIHKDIDLDFPTANPDFAINLPVTNCDNVDMYWYKQRDNTSEILMPGVSKGARTPKLEYHNGICIDSVNCNQPTLVEISDWHSISNNSLERTSRLISIRFYPQLKREKALGFLYPKALRC